MKKMSAEERIAELKKTLEYHIDRYYNQDSPEISDYEYDMMMQELKNLEKEHPELVTPDSPTQRVGGTAKREAGVLVRHNVPMLSLQDVFSKEEVFNFVEEMQKQLDHPEFVVEYKIDGLSMSLRYENGELILAETRGDGINFGEDVTANAKVIKDVKQKLKDKPEYLEIRGEVYMKNAAFEKVNETQELLGKKVFANPRNCAAGTLRQLDSKVTKERDLSMFIFNIQQVRGMEFATHTEGYEFLKKQGIHVIDDYKVCKTAEEVWDAITAIGENRGNLAYDIDGAVVKINRFSDREQLGETSKVPRWAIAYKYPPEEKESRLLNIELSVGRTGRITPTAVFEPVRLCGTSVSRATLHNQDFIDDLDIGIGDTIVVYKSGEIIPKIKVSENVEKITTPHFKQVYRLFDNKTGKALGDVLTIHDEVIDPALPYVLFHPIHTWKQRVVTDYTVRPLRQQIFKNGECIYQSPSITEIRDYCMREVDTLWDQIKRFENPQTYFVDLSKKLWTCKNELLESCRI